MTDTIPARVGALYALQRPCGCIAAWLNGAATRPPVTGVEGAWLYWRTQHAVFAHLAVSSRNSDWSAYEVPGPHLPTVGHRPGCPDYQPEPREAHP